METYANEAAYIWHYGFEVWFPIIAIAYTVAWLTSLGKWIERFGGKK